MSTLTALHLSTSTGYQPCGRWIRGTLRSKNKLTCSSRFVPGLVTMEVITLVFPIVHIFKRKKAVRETTQALADFDMKKLSSDPTTTESVTTRSTGKRGKMYSMESLDECLNYNYDGLQVYASCMELNGENIIFLVKVLNFQESWFTTFLKAHDFGKSRMVMFRTALSIYVTLVNAETASYPINIESPIYAKLESVFGTATSLVASKRDSSSPTTPISAVSPWDEPAELTLTESKHDAYPMQAMSSPPTRPSSSNDSSEHIISFDGPADDHDPLASFGVPTEFDEHVFDAAFKSIKYMVWTETWQRYMQWKRSSASVV